MKMICPHCGVVGSTDNSFLGTKVKCPKCLGIFEITADIVEPIAVDETELMQPEHVLLAEDDDLDDGIGDISGEVDDAFDDIFGEEEDETPAISGEDDLGELEGLDEIDVSEEDDLGELEGLDELDVSGEDDLGKLEGLDELNLSEDLDDDNSELLQLLDQQLGEDDEPIAALSDLGIEEDEAEQDWDGVPGTLSLFEQKTKDEDDEAERVADEADDEDGTLQIIEDLPRERKKQLAILEGESKEVDYADGMDGEKWEIEEETTDDDEYKEEYEEYVEDKVEETDADAQDFDWRPDDDLGDEGDIIQKCSACGEYVNPESKYTHGKYVYCAKCVPAAALVKERESSNRLNFSDHDDSSVGRFTVSTLIKDSWSYCKGAKRSIWAAFAVMCLILFGINLVAIFLLPLLFGTSESIIPMLLDAVLQIIAGFVSYLLTAGLLLIAVKRVGGQPFTWRMIFEGFKNSRTFAVAIILQAAMVSLGFIIFVLPGIYLSVAYMLTFPLIMVRGLSPWQAMEASRKAIHKRWWTVFLAFIAMTVICGISAIPFGIGLIWTIPMCYIMIGILYYHFFGNEE